MIVYFWPHQHWPWGNHTSVTTCAWLELYLSPTAEINSLVHKMRSVEDLRLSALVNGKDKTPRYPYQIAFFCIFQWWKAAAYIRGGTGGSVAPGHSERSENKGHVWLACATAVWPFVSQSNLKCFSEEHSNTLHLPCDYSKVWFCNKSNCFLTYRPVSYSKLGPPPILFLLPLPQ